MLGILIHIIGDAINNKGVILPTLNIWKAEIHTRYYTNPKIEIFIALIIFLIAITLKKRSGCTVLQFTPEGTNLTDVKHAIETAKLRLSYPC